MKKPLKVAAWSGLFLIILSIIVNIPPYLIKNTRILNLITSPIYLITSILAIFFAYGFVALGKKFNNKLLVVLAWIGIAISILLSILFLFGTIFSIIGFSQPSLSPENFTTNLTGNFSSSYELQQSLGSGFLGIILGIFIVLIIIVILISVLSILNGVALLKLKGKVSLAETAGILEIIGGATLIIFIGIFVLLAAYIVEIIMFFKASKKFEK
ncbi:hypothetical protein J4466_02415 [Candidatus Pacearchaeota archaeon]|nr:hypothetical protein [Candidatus Pacearchaeota archaeon]